MSKFMLKGAKANRAKKNLSQEDKIKAEQFANEAETVTQVDTAEDSINHILDIPLEQIDPNHFNARTFYSDEKVKERAASLASEGQLVPAIVVRDGDRFKLIDGHYRYKGASLNGMATLRCEVLQEGLSGFEYFKASYAANEERQKQLILDSAVVWKKLVEDEGMSQQELCEITKRSKGEISKVIKIGSIPMQYMEVLAKKETPLGIAAGYAVSQIFDSLGDSSEFEKIVHDIVEGDLPKKDIEQMAKSIKTGATAKKKKSKTLPKHQITNSHGKVFGTLDQRGKKISMNFDATSPEQAEKILEKIAEILKENVDGQ